MFLAGKLPSSMELLVASKTTGIDFVMGLKTLLIVSMATQYMNFIFDLASFLF